MANPALVQGAAPIGFPDLGFKRQYYVYEAAL